MPWTYPISDSNPGASNVLAMNSDASQIVGATDVIRLIARGALDLNQGQIIYPSSSLLVVAPAPGALRTDVVTWTVDYDRNYGTPIMAFLGQVMIYPTTDYDAMGFAIGTTISPSVTVPFGLTLNWAIYR